MDLVGTQAQTAEDTEEGLEGTAPPAGGTAPPAAAHSLGGSADRVERRNRIAQDLLRAPSHRQGGGAATPDAAVPRCKEEFIEEEEEEGGYGVIEDWETQSEFGEEPDEDGAIYTSELSFSDDKELNVPVVAVAGPVDVIDLCDTDDDTPQPVAKRQRIDDASVPDAAISPPVSGTASLTVDQAAATVQGGSTPEQYATCVDTLFKAMDKIVANPTEEKFRKIKTSNKGINSRVGGLTGGRDLMSAVGFLTQNMDGDEFYYIQPTTEAREKVIRSRESLRLLTERAKAALPPPPPLASP
jgi:hypothetical protein